MGVTREYDPVEPERNPTAEVERLRREWLETSTRMRAILTVYLAIGAWGGLVGGHLLTSAYSNWITWSVTLLILEPIGGTSVAALIYLYWPNSWVGGQLQKILRRARLGMLIVAVCVIGWLVWAVSYLVIEAWKLW